MVGLQAVASTLTGSPSQESAKIDKSAKDFESILLGNWLQQAEHSFAKVPGTDDEEGEDDATSQLQEGVAMQPLGEAMAASGGIGIARMIARQLHAAPESSPVGPPANPPPSPPPRN